MNLTDRRRLLRLIPPGLPGKSRLGRFYIWRLGDFRNGAGSPLGEPLIQGVEMLVARRV
jgi:hypothetical protein